MIRESPMKAKLIGVVMGVAVWMGTASTSAEDAAVASLKTRLVGASLFKNGLGFLAREGPLPKGDVKILLEGLPAPVHGTLWVDARGEATIRELVAFERESAP